MKKLIGLFTKKDNAKMGAKGYLANVDKVCSDWDKINAKIMQNSFDNR